MHTLTRRSIYCIEDSLGKEPPLVKIVVLHSPKLLAPLLRRLFKIR